MRRLRFALWSVLAVVLVAVALFFLADSLPLEAEEPPLTGQPNTNLKNLDDAMLAFMAKQDIPGGALAVVKDGRLVYARGYGWADKEHGIPVQPTSAFRLASISKTITSTAVMTLVQDGKLSLDAPAFAQLGLKPHLEPGAHVDPRLAQITVRQLLQHTGGFDSAKSGDPMFMPLKIARAVGSAEPADQDAIIRYMLGRPLDWDPGTHYAYSNFGYCVLGQIIAKVSGQPYGDYVQQHVLHPMGITHMQLGRTLRRYQQPGSVVYYQPSDGLVTPVFPEAKAEKVPWPYGGFSLEAHAANGGWTASAVDLARFAAQLDFPDDGKPLLGADSVRETFARPAAPVWREANGKLTDYYYGCGWLVRPAGQGGKMNRWHNGSLPGTYTLFVRRWDGMDWCVLFNHRTESVGDIDPVIYHAIDAVKQWPSGDLFEAYQADL